MPAAAPSSASVRRPVSGAGAGASRGARPAAPCPLGGVMIEERPPRRRQVWTSAAVPAADSVA